MKKLETYLIEADQSQGKPQRGVFKRKRAGEQLTREQVRAIKNGRKLLRKEMRSKGLKEKSDFELTASNMGLYFDKPRALLWLQWLFHGKGLWALLGALVLLLATLFLFSVVSQLRGHFTINMSDGMFREGFILSETADFANPSTHLFCTPADKVPCISISNLPDYLDEIDGQHNEEYFAYTFYCRNEGQSTVDLQWKMSLNSESRDLSSACWVMIFEDGKMTFYAQPNGETGEPEALPAMDDDSRGYIMRPLEQFCKDPEAQYQTIREGRGFEYSRVVPVSFASDVVVAQGLQENVAPGDVHKYTVVIWLEGDDPDCSDELIGGHAGMDFRLHLVGESGGSGGHGNGFAWDDIWNSLKFW